MAYFAPTLFSEGYDPAHTDLNKIIDNLEAVYAVHPLVKWNNATAVDREHTEWFTDLGALEDSGLAFVHVFKYLAFRGSGVIVDPAGLEDNVAISDENDVTFYDLESISWLSYGMVYYIEGCDWAQEVDFY